jgi:hypothetical protein
MDRDTARELLEVMREIAETSGARDGFDVANLVIAAVSAFATTVLAAFAAYIAYKSHLLDSKARTAQDAADRTAVRERFRLVLQEHVANLLKGFTKRMAGEVVDVDPMDTGPAMQTAARTFANSDGYGAKCMADAIHKFEVEARNWDSSQYVEFGSAVGLFLATAAHWSRDPDDWKKTGEAKMKNRIAELVEKATHSDAAPTD